MDDSARPQPGPGSDPDEPSLATPPAPALPEPAAPPIEPPAPPADPPRHTRRWVLAGALAVLAGGGAGVGAGFLRHRPRQHRPPATPPDVLVAAAEAERRLIADLVATTGGTASVRIVIEQATVNHRAHLAALAALLGRYGPPATTVSRVPGAPRTRAQLRAAEQKAAKVAAERAGRRPGREAVLLASIAACEASHAELFT